MFLLHGEREVRRRPRARLYNGLLSGVSPQRRPLLLPEPARVGRRLRSGSPWFDVACCPPNMPRFLPSLPGYVYARTDDDIFVNLFIAGTATDPRSPAAPSS